MESIGLLILFALCTLLIQINASNLTLLNILKPQIPQASDSAINNRDFFISPPAKLDPFKTSDGSEINPDFEGSNWNRRDTMFNTLNPITSDHSMDWFPSITTNHPNQSDHSFSSSSNSSIEKDKEYSSNYPEFIHKVSVIDANNFFNDTLSYRRDLKLLNFVFTLISSTSNELNILHLGTGSGYVPLALTILGRHTDAILTLDDQNTWNTAKENIIKDGKSYFLRHLRFKTIENIPNSITSKTSETGKPFDLVVFSKSIPQNYTFPSDLIMGMNPRGFMIYPEDGKKLKMDQLDGNGKFTNIKTIYIK